MLGMLCCILLLSIAPSRADEIFQRRDYFQRPERLYEGADYDPAIPAPSTILGFQPGEWFPSPEQTRTYLEALAAASPRVNLSAIGRTYEGRPLLLATISSVPNLARLDDIRRNLIRLRSEPMLENSAALEEVLADTPAVVWLTYSVHGNEHSGTDAALRTAYHLAADRSPATQRWLDSVVILLDPCKTRMDASDSCAGRNPPSPGMPVARTGLTPIPWPPNTRSRGHPAASITTCST